MTSSTSVAGVSMLVRVSVPSTIAGCPAQDPGQPGRNYINAVVEPQVAVSGSHVIAMWHQDRWSNGGGHGIGVVYNNGNGWNQTTLGSDMCDTPVKAPLHIYQRSSDPSTETQIHGFRSGLTASPTPRRSPSTSRFPTGPTRWSSRAWRKAPRHGITSRQSRDRSSRSSRRARTRTRPRRTPRERRPPTPCGTR